MGSNGKWNQNPGIAFKMAATIFVFVISESFLNTKTPLITVVSPVFFWSFNSNIQPI